MCQVYYSETLHMGWTLVARPSSLFARPSRLFACPSRHSHGKKSAEKLSRNNMNPKKQLVLGQLWKFWAFHSCWRGLNMTAVWVPCQSFAPSERATGALKLTCWVVSVDAI